MSRFTKIIEKIMQRISDQFSWISTVICLLTLGFFIVDRIAGFTEAMNFQLLIGIGKHFGSLAVISALLASVYYLLRVIYIWLRQLHPEMLKNNDLLWKNSLKTARLLHPTFGVLAINFAVVHAYLIWFSKNFNSTITLLLGFGAMALLIGTIYLGNGIRVKYRINNLPQKHRITAILFFSLCFLHILTK